MMFVQLNCNNRDWDDVFVCSANDLYLKKIKGLLFCSVILAFLAKILTPKQQLFTQKKNLSGV